MRRLIFLITLLLGFEVRVLLAQDATLSGQWRLDIDKSISLFDLNSKNRYDSLAPDGKERLRSTMADRTFRFEEDGGFLVEWKSGTEIKSISGTWVLSGNSDRVIITVSATTTEYAISFSENLLVLRNLHGQGYLTTLCFFRE